MLARDVHATSLPATACSPETTASDDTQKQRQGSSLAGEGMGDSKRGSLRGGEYVENGAADDSCGSAALEGVANALARDGLVVVPSAAPRQLLAAARAEALEVAQAVLGACSESAHAANALGREFKCTCGAGGRCRWGLHRACRCPVHVTPVLRGEQLAFRERARGRFDILLRHLAAAEVAKDLPPHAAHLSAYLLGSRAFWRPLAVQVLGPGAWACAVGLLWAQGGAGGGGWHIDGDRIQADAPYCLHVFLPLVDVDATNGATQLLPGSHVTGTLAAHYEAEVVQPAIRAGGALVFDYRTWHRAPENPSKEARPVLYVTVAAPWYREQRDWPPGSTAPFEQKASGSREPRVE